ncbi:MULTISPECIES: helix-turn-helix domain-containing protein [Devosia]|uniref:helix-turn-helix domain-containing protein n=1 Tax=Devosia TaxID=46913 RepID=UPI000CE9AD4B|nr:MULTISPECIES: helix-turn-helix domain-containing protein [Devosia]AVF03766.1 hypothetical protein C4375_08530 [Devosia sp. I507]
MEKIAFTIAETSQCLGVGTTTIYKLIDAGSLERIKIGKRALVLAESIDAFVERSRIDSRERAEKVAALSARLEAAKPRSGATK